MKINLIIGAGQLGSRHLQGLLRLEVEQIIYVLDPSNDSLKISEERAKEIRHNHKIIFTTSWNDLPKEFDFVVVATGANVRSVVTKQLLENYKVNYLVLEKILFQDLTSYETIGKLISETNTTTWVNHPRRMMDHYQEIRNSILASNEKVVFQTVGSNWGLACSAMHFIDLCAFLTNSKVKTNNMDLIDPVIYESKRDNCIEFTGTVSGTMQNGSNFIISSIEGEIGDITITIATNSDRWIIQEGKAQKIIRMSKENGFNPEILSYVTKFQSFLTTRIASDILETGKCDLPSYKQACESHIPFIEAALKKYTELSGITTTICPIT
ncbi:MAG: Gfo/Idh/MocA family oxidoreductase [Flavobacterium sp.]|nr:Gfo/Idh/MocA family oxidoreductase [Flavobacterium sp.]